MGVTIGAVRGYLDRRGVHYEQSGSGSQVSFLAETPPRGGGGDGPPLRVVVRLLERGGVLRLEFPMERTLRDCRHRSAVLETLMRIQTRSRLIRFDLVDDTILPVVETVLEDSPSTAGQFGAVMHLSIGIVHGARTTIDQVMESGEVPIDDGPPP